MKVDRTCEQCGGVFTVKPSRVAQGKARFCSIACRRLVPPADRRALGPYLTLNQAVALGARFYAGSDCAQGHGGIRYTKSAQCVPCARAKSLAAPRVERDPVERAWGRLKRLYGLDKAGYRELERKQGGACAICRDPLTDKRSHVDHCHATGKVRGILCGPCNQAIGLFRECVTRLARAAEYINFHKEGIAA